MSVHPALAAHAARFTTPQIWQSGSNVYTAFGYNIANVSMIVGTDGVIIVDTAAQETNATEILAAFRKITDLPIKAVIYTHFHNDHVNGVGAFISQGQVDAGEVEVIAHQDLMSFIAGISGYLAPLMGRRASYQFGAALPRDDSGFVYSGLGLPHNPGPRGFIAPTCTVGTRTAMTIAGIELEIVPMPGESDDHIGVWLPDEKVLLTGDTIQGEVLPNVYTLRGTPYRNPVQWVRTLDFVRDGFDAQVVIPHHGRRLVGRTQIDDVITAYRDSIQFLNDQTLRMMNKGMRPQDIARSLKLPPHLANHEWLGEFYGSIKHIVPSIAQGNVGWFDGDPLKLDPLPDHVRAARHIALMGGAGNVKNQAEQALAEGEFQWAMELSRYLLDAEPTDQDNRTLHANVLRKWAYDQANPTWRNWGLMSAKELDPPSDAQAPAHLMAPPGVIKAFPPSLVLKTMSVRLKAEEVFDTKIALGFHVPELEATYCLEIRCGVCQFHEHALASTDATLTVPRQFFIDLASRKTTWPKAIAAGDLKIAGDATKAAAFFTYFEPPTVPHQIKFVG